MIIRALNAGVPARLAAAYEVFVIGTLSSVEAIREECGCDGG